MCIYLVYVVWFLVSMSGCKNHKKDKQTMKFIYASFLSSFPSTLPIVASSSPPVSPLQIPTALTNSHCTYKFPLHLQIPTALTNPHCTYKFPLHLQIPTALTNFTAPTNSHCTYKSPLHLQIPTELTNSHCTYKFSLHLQIPTALTNSH